VPEVLTFVLIAAVPILSLHHGGSYDINALRVTPWRPELGKSALHYLSETYWPDLFHSGEELTMENFNCHQCVV
jgi:hypothetical protein